ncbi:cellulase family glycosylhydrolase [Microdochium nivale]|nr:cellulase family glycosylhydrolase [Microdochium nivale]
MSTFPTLPGNCRSPLSALLAASRMLTLLLISFVLLGGYFQYILKVEAALNERWTPDTGAQLFSQRPLPPFIEETAITTYALPLSTSGRDVVDATGRRFKLSSVNWYGASDEIFVPAGLEVQHRSVIARTIRLLGFNSVRLPYADEMVIENPHILPHLLTANPDLVGLRALDIYAACVEALTDAGIAVIINNHITTATWCCGADPCDSGWANDHLGPICRISQSEEDWIQHWEAVMQRFVDNPLVIGADLRNEVRGAWGTMPWSRWAAAAEKCGNRLLAMNRDWLIIVGGTESNNDLSGVRLRPVELDVKNRVVYTSHIYAWSGWGSKEGRYSKRSYASFTQAMRHNWAYLVEDDVAPVWVGEFGAPRHPGMGDINYWENLMRYLKKLDADFAYWAVNPRKPHDNELETYSLVEDDWLTPILDYRMRDMTELIAGSSRDEWLKDYSQEL